MSTSAAISRVSARPSDLRPLASCASATAGSMSSSRPRLARTRGDNSHPGTRGYTCNKAMRLGHHQNGRQRLTTPLRWRADGSFEEIGWDTPIAEVTAGGRRSVPRRKHVADEWNEVGDEVGDEPPAVVLSRSCADGWIALRECQSPRWLSPSPRPRGERAHPFRAGGRGPRPTRSNRTAVADAVELLAQQDATRARAHPRRGSGRRLGDAQRRPRPADARDGRTATPRGEPTATRSEQSSHAARRGPIYRRSAGASASTRPDPAAARPRPPSKV
jgi:hypothetical protein